MGQCVAQLLARSKENTKHQKSTFVASDCPGSGNLLDQENISQKEVSQLASEVEVRCHQHLPSFSSTAITGVAFMADI
jgi:hypothetical protein